MRAVHVLCVCDLCVIVCMCHRHREREKSNSKTLILKDSSIRSIWTYLTASPSYTTNTNKHDYTTDIINTNKQLVNAVPQMCRNIGIKFLPWTYMQTTIKFLGNHVIQTNLSKFDERLCSDIYLCRLHLKQGKEVQNFILWGREF